MTLRKTILAAAAFAVAASLSAADYGKGLFIINEDWYGHQNSTVNHLDPDAVDGTGWTYRAFQAENPGRQIGCTAQFAAIHNGKIYFIAKQAKDPGASVKGGRITVADAATLKMTAQLERIDPSGASCDGRAFLGIDASKGYVSSSNGVWVLNLADNTIDARIEGTGNAGGSLYRGQCGNMVLSGGRVFVAHQSRGVLVVDPVDDSIESVVDIASALIDAGLWQPSDADLADIEAGRITLAECAPGVGSVIVDRRGFVWASLSADINGMGSTFGALLQIDPATLSVTAVSIPSGVDAPMTSWYAWTPDAFCASMKNSWLYWRGGNRWFSGDVIWKYDYESNAFSKVIDTSAEDGDWHIFGCSMRVHPETDLIYASLYHNNQSQIYLTRSYDSDGNIVAQYPMIENYWFPSIPFFVPSHNQGAVDVVPVEPGPDIYYDMHGRCLGSATPPPGMYIVKNRLSVKKMIIR